MYRIKYIEFLVAGHIFSVLALSGLPNFSYLASIFLLLLILTLAFRAINNRLYVEKWITSPAIFIISCAAWSALSWDKSQHAFFVTAVAWVGAITVGVALQNGVRLNAFLIPIVLGAIANFLAIVFGFDAYIEYSADFSRESEELLLKRSSGLTGNSNVVAIQAILTLFLVVLLNSFENKFLFLIALFCAGHALIATGSRKGLYLALIFLPFIALYIGRLNKYKIFTITTLVFLAILSVIFATTSSTALPEWAEKIEAIQRVKLALHGQDTSYLERMYFIDAGINAFLERPIIGYGLDQFRHFIGNGLYAHNNLVELAVSGGILLLAAYYQIYLISLREIWKAKKINTNIRICLTLLLGTLLGLDFGMVTYQSKFIALILIVTITFTHNAAKRSNKITQLPDFDYARTR